MSVGRGGGPWQQALGVGLMLGLALLAPGLLRAGKERKATTADAPVPAWLREAAAKAGSAVAKGASVEVLHEEMIIEPLAAGGVRVTTRLAERAVTADGLHEVATYAMEYDEGDDVEVAAGWNLLADGGVRTPDPKDDVDDLPWSGDGTSIDDVRLRNLRLPGVAVGSVAGFESRVVRHLDTGAMRFLFGDMDRPTALSRATLRLPEGWTGSAVVLRGEALMREETEGSIVLRAEMLAAPPREDPPGSASVSLPLAWFTWRSPDGERGFSDWAAVGRWVHDLTQPTLANAGEARTLSDRIAPAVPAALADSLARAFDFASREVRYVSIQLGRGGWSGYVPPAPAETCTKRYGDCKAKSFLVRSIVEPWGVATFPVLVRTDSAGPVLEGVPTPSQFNHCIVGVVLPEGVLMDAWNVLSIEGVGRVAFLDPTATMGSAFELPEGDQGTLALLVHPEASRLVRLPVQPPSAAVARRRVTLKLDEQGGIVEAQVVEEWSGSHASFIRQVRGRSDANQRRRELEERLNWRFPGARIESHEVSGLDDSLAPVVETTRLAGGRFGRRTLDMILVEPAKVSFGIVQGELGAARRLTALELGAPRTERLEVSVVPPDGWRCEALPGAFKLSDATLAAEGAWRMDGRAMVYERTARLLSHVVMPDAHESFRSMLKSLRAEDSRNLVLVPDAPAAAPAEVKPASPEPPQAEAASPEPPPADPAPDRP